MMTVMCGPFISLASVVLLWSLGPACGTTIAVYASEPSPLMNATGDSYENWIGLEADIIRHLCDGEYLDNCSFIKVYDLASRLQVLENGTADVSIGGISFSEDRAKEAQYIQPYYFEYNGFFYTDATGMQKLTSYGDVEGANICVLQGSTYAEDLESQYGATIVPIETREDAALFIKNGSCIAWAGDPIFSFPDQVGLERVGLPSFVSEPMGAMVALNAPRSLVSSLQAGISSLFDDGNDSLILQYQNNNLVAPGLIPAEKNIASQVDAISSFTTPLTISDGSIIRVNNGSPGVADGQQFNVTVAIWADNLPPLAELEGTRTFLEEGSSWNGIEIDLLTVICNAGSISCDQDIIQVNTLEDRLDVVQNGTADISVGAIIITPDRLEKVPFAVPFYYSSGLGLFVDDAGYDEFRQETSPEFLRGKNVCSQEGSAWGSYLEEYNVRIITVDDSASAIEAIANNQCIAFAYDSFYAIPGLTELPLVFKDTQLPYGIAISPDVPSALYSTIVGNLIDGLSKGQESFLLKSQAEAVETFGTLANPALQNVTNIISYLSPDTPSDTESPDAAPEAENSYPPSNPKSGTDKPVATAWIIMASLCAARGSVLW